MSHDALFLVIIAAFAHAAWNIIAHGSSRSGPPFLFWGAVASTIIWVPVVPLTGGIGEGGWRGLLLGAGVSALLHVGYMVLLQRGYAAGDLSTVYATARGTGPILTVAVAILLLGESPSPMALVGVAVVILGVVAMGVIGRPRKLPRFGGAVGGESAPSDPSEPSDTARLAVDSRFEPASSSTPASGAARRKPARRRIDPALVYGLATGVAIAAYTIWDTHALREWQVSPVALMVGCGLFEVPFLAALAWRRRAELLPTLREQWRRLLLFGVLSPLSYILVLVAVTIAPVSLVAPVREMSVVLVSLFGAFIGKEQRPALRVMASAAVVGGVLLLSV